MKFKSWRPNSRVEEEPYKGDEGQNNDYPAEALKAHESTAEEAVVYSSDAPIEDPKLDRFDREPFARRIAETLARRRDSASMILAIYGPRGDGKTTVLNFMRDRLSKDTSVVCVNSKASLMVKPD